MESQVRSADVVVIGAGQAGLSAAHHLQRRGGVSVVHLDAEHGPGGAWRHRWDSLTMATVNGIRELPGMPEIEAARTESANRAVPEYFAEFERRLGTPIERPVHVTAVQDDPSTEPSPDPAADPVPLLVRSRDPDGRPRAPLRTRAVLNATGTWTRPFVPALSGAGRFRGRQLHTAGYRRAEDFAGMRVGIIGGGISAIGHLLEIAEVGETFWYTRREPVFEDRPFTTELGRAAVAEVEDRVRQGLPVRSVVSVTGLPLTPALREARRRGILARRPMFTEITADGVREADGRETALDVLLWATGFRHELRHLRPLRLHNAQGGITMDGTAVAHDPRIHLLGYGPSASTIGANRAGRAAAGRVLRDLARRRAPA